MREAIIQSNKEPIIASGKIGKNKYVCPDCWQSVYLRRRAHWIDHFCHKPSSKCKTKLSISQESQQHRAGKKAICDWLNQPDRDLPFINRLAKKELDYDAVVSVSEEKTIKLFDGTRRIIDVAIIDVTQSRESREVSDAPILEAYECQLSPILIGGQDGLEKRTLDYIECGIKNVYWWFGTNSFTSTVKQWCEKIFKNGEWICLKTPEFELYGFMNYDFMDLSSLLAARVKTDLGTGNPTVPIRTESDILLKCIPISDLVNHIKAAVTDALDDGEEKLAADICAAWSKYTSKDRQEYIESSSTGDNLPLQIEDYAGTSNKILSTLVG